MRVFEQLPLFALATTGVALASHMISFQKRKGSKIGAPRDTTDRGHNGFAVKGIKDERDATTCGGASAASPAAAIITHARGPPRQPARVCGCSVSCHGAAEKRVFHLPLRATHLHVSLHERYKQTSLSTVVQANIAFTRALKRHTQVHMQCINIQINKRLPSGPAGEPH